MKFSLGLVLAALAVTAANADERKHLRETKEEEFGETNYDDAAIGGSIKTPDEDFMIDLSDLFGSQSPDIQDKINILDLIGSGSNQISLEELVQAFGDDSTSDNGKMTGFSDDDAEDPINLKGGMYDPVTEIEDPINAKGGTKGVPVDESYESIDWDGNVDDLKKFVEVDMNDLSPERREAAFAAIEAYRDDFVGNSASGSVPDTQPEDITNVKGVPVGESSESDNSDGRFDDINKGVQDMMIALPPEGQQAVVAAFEAYRDDLVGKSAYGSDADPDTEIEDIVNVKGGNHGVPVTEDIDESYAMENEIEDDVQVKGSASSPATKMVKTSDVSASYIDKLYEDGSDVFGKSDEEDSPLAKKSSFMHEEEEDEQSPLQSELVSEKKATKISEPFY